MTENDRNDRDNRDDRTGPSAAPGGSAAPGTPPQGLPKPEKPTSGGSTGGASTPGAGGGTPPPYVPPTSPPAAGQSGPRSGAVPASGGQAGQKRGQVRKQEAGVTQPRPPTLAEQRARAEAIHRRQEAERAEELELARKKKLRKRLLIGGGVAVGVAGVVAIWYAASSPDDVEAQCTQDGVVVDDQYCDDNYARSHGGYTSGGFIYIGGSSYRYHYGGPSVPAGQKVSGGTYTVPKGANVKTKSGTTIQRGGFGVSGGSKSGGS
ncbi:hypothetical protein [Actinosynnema sp. NPDC023587]|uniref:hypothetical protein n=1 Tax=Actinosynnema sp. NPDC023587 TaxID=3154695 RepID=UPI00340E471F